MLATGLILIGVHYLNLLALPVAHLIKRIIFRMTRTYRHQKKNLFVHEIQRIIVVQIYNTLHCAQNQLEFDVQLFTI